MSRTLLAVISCHKRLEWNAAIRSTWLPLFPQTDVDVRFFYGRGEHTPTLSDEVVLDCDDNYEGLPEKVQCIIKWSLDHRYERTIKCDDDVVIHPTRFLHSGYQSYDFSGPLNGKVHLDDRRTHLDIPWGFYYNLSKRSMEAIVSAILPKNNNDEWFIAETLASYGIRLKALDGYYLWRGTPPVLPPSHRPLRRHKAAVESINDGTAVCMYIGGYEPGRAPTEVSLTEFQKVFTDMFGKLATQINQ